MNPSRSYALTCPIARALDSIGDRWALLILRDLHAGPARFSDLREALPGLATNLLSTRLNELAARGMIQREGPERGARYGLTPLGMATRPVLLDLALLGAHLPPPPLPVAPGNRRHVAVTLAVACERVAPPDLDLRAEIVLDGEPFSFVVTQGSVQMEAGPMLAPPLRYSTAYDTLAPVVSGEMSLEVHLAEHATLESLDGSDSAPLGRLFGRALSFIGGHSEP